MHLQAGGSGLSLRVRRIPGAGNGSPLQCSRLENRTDRGAGRAVLHGVANSRTQPSNYTATASELSGWRVKVGRCFLHKSKQKVLQGEGQHGVGDEEWGPRPGTRGGGRKAGRQGSECGTQRAACGSSRERTSTRNLDEDSPLLHSQRPKSGSNPSVHQPTSG